jgi:isopentenyl phosphate kinase
MKEIKDFLTKVLTADAITPALRKEALQLRDTIDLCSKRKNVGVITEIGFTLSYPGTINDEKDVTIVMRDIQDCEARAREERTNNNDLTKIGMIKQVRRHYGCGLKEAKEVTEWLLNNSIIAIDN